MRNLGTAKTGRDSAEPRADDWHRPMLPKQVPDGLRSGRSCRRSGQRLRYRGWRTGWRRSRRRRYSCCMCIIQPFTSYHFPSIIPVQRLSTGGRCPPSLGAITRGPQAKKLLKHKFALWSSSHFLKNFFARYTRSTAFYVPIRNASM